MGPLLFIHVKITPQVLAPRYGKAKDDSSNNRDFKRDAEWQSHEDEANNGSEFFEDEQDLSEQRSQLAIQ